MKKEILKKVIFNNRKKLILMAIGMVIAIVLIITGIILGQNSKKGDTNITEDTNQYSEILIDMENTENAEVKDGVKTNKSEKVLEDKMYNDMKVSEATITATKEMSTFTAKIKSDLEKQIEGEVVFVSFLRKDGTQIAKIETYFPNMEEKGENIIIATTNEDIANSYDYTITKE